MRLLLICVCSLVLPQIAAAKNVALILNDDEQAALRVVLDDATKAQGLQIAPTTVYLLNKLNSAGTIVEHKDDPPKDDPPKDKGPQQ